MKILHVNKFFFLKGGPERYMFNVSELLEAKGHKVAFFSMEHEDNADSEWHRYFVKNIDYDREFSLGEKAGIFKNTLYSREAEKKLSSLLEDFKPDIAHLHNFHHQLTPSILSALDKKSVPVVMKLSDYKMVCPSYTMLKHGRICELCRSGKFYKCALTRCYKDSFSKSLLAAIESYLHHRVLNSYRHIKYFICPSDFMMDKAKEMGLKGNFIRLSNFVDTKNFKPAKDQKEKKLLFWGRLTYEKGLNTLIDAVKGIPVKLEIIGDGPLNVYLNKKIKQERIKNVSLLGYLKGEELYNKIREGYAALLSSVWYENNPNSILEAFAMGIPVIGSRVGGIPELVKDGETGLLFELGNIKDLRDKIERLLAHPDKAAQMGSNARRLAEKKYSAEPHYKRLMEIYNNALGAGEEAEDDR